MSLWSAQSQHGSATRPFLASLARPLPSPQPGAQRLSSELLEAVRGGRGHELLPFTGQSAGMIGEILPTGEIVHQMVAEAEQALRVASRFLS